MGEDSRFRYVAKVKRFLRGQTSETPDQHDIPRRLLDNNNTFPSGIKLLHTPENGNGTVEYSRPLTPCKIYIYIVLLASSSSTA